MLGAAGFVRGALESCTGIEVNVVDLGLPDLVRAAEDADVAPRAAVADNRDLASVGLDSPRSI